MHHTRVACAVFALVVTMALYAGAASADDLQAVKHRGILRHLGIPYANFVTGDGQGMDVELMQLFAKHLGVAYEYRKTDWSNIFSGLTGKTYTKTGDDIQYTGSAEIQGDIAANGITVLPWRQKLVNFSKPTFPNQVWVIARADMSVKPIKPSGNIEADIAAVKKLLMNRSLLGKTGTCLEPSLYNIEATGAKVQLFPGKLDDMAPALLNGDAALTLLDVPDALIALQKWPGKIKILGPVSPMQDMAAAFSPDSPALQKEFETFLEKCKKDGTYIRLVKKYYPYVTDFYPEFFK
ncbi:MAG TPA: transporter substrate-binding domain-containing protein [Nitrospirota bacterium]|nr:transporter substrate-binding domain-containing protein [Nitrospirota bacterium]